MDPLSVSASIAGLMAAAQQVSSLIGLILRSTKTGPQEVADIKLTVETLRSVFLQLRLLILDRACIDPQRTSLILLDQVVVTLTARVMTFSDLDGCVKGLFNDVRLGFLDGMRWASKTAELTKYLRSLESHKSSLILMISILTW
jgi:hypothetical protein